MTAGAASRPDQIVSDLVNRLRSAGLEATIIEPNSRIMVNCPGKSFFEARQLVLKANSDGVLAFWWDWGAAVYPISDMDTVVMQVARMYPKVEK